MNYTQIENPVKIYSYLGSLPDHVGNDGDFYVDEMTNMLYGPKVEGIWPEEGVSAEGLCKRTWIGLPKTRLTRRQAETPGFFRQIRLFLHWLLTGEAPEEQSTVIPFRPR